MFYLFLPSSMNFANVASECEPNDLLTFFNFGGNNDILSFINLIQRYLRKLHQNENQLICQVFSTPVGTMIFYLFLTELKEVDKSFGPISDATFANIFE